MCILVVDDDDLVRRTVVEMLDEASGGVVAAKSGAEALRVLRTRPEIELVLSDVNMPEMDGLTLLEEVKAIRPSLPVILMSGRPCASHSGAFLSKPFTRARLFDCIARSRALRGGRSEGLAPSHIRGVPR